MPKMVHFGEFWKPVAYGHTVLPGKSILKWQKLMENAQIQKFKCDIFSNFQTLCKTQKAQNHQLPGFKSAIYWKWIFSMQRFSPSKWICAHAESSEEDEDYSIFSRFWIYAFSGSKKRKTWIRKFLGYFQENGNSITFLCSYENWPLSSWNISILHQP